MSTPQHALDFLTDTARLPDIAAIVIFGPEPFLKRQALDTLKQRLLAAQGQADDASVTHYDGEQSEWRDVQADLSTRSLFGGGRHVVVVDDADKFVSKNRDKLEDYVGRVNRAGTLVLLVDQWAATTKLYKAVAEAGLQIECRVPQLSGRGGKGVDEGRICRWVIERGKSRHGANVEPEAARLLVDLVGPEFGLLDQELAKLSVFAADGTVISPQLVRNLAGGWRSKTTWDLVDAATGGDAVEALRQLDQLLQAGQEPIALMGAIGWSLRRFAAATRMFERAEREGTRMSITDALVAAGVARFPPLLEKAERQLQQLGRARAARLYRALLEIDLALKSTHSNPQRSRWQLEQLLLRLSRQLDPRRKSVSR